MVETEKRMKGTSKNTHLPPIPSLGVSLRDTLSVGDRRNLGIFRGALNAAKSQGGPRSGVTLLELLIVLALMAGLLGIGVGVYGQLDLDRQAAPGKIRGMLRMTRSSALFESAPSRVLLDAEKGMLQPLVYRTIGTWHFEKKDMKGAFRIPAFVSGAVLDPDGRIGSALSFRGGSGEWADLDVGKLSSFQAPEGLRLEFDLYWNQNQNAILFQRKGSFELRATSRGAFAVAMEVGGETGEGAGTIRFQTDESLLHLDQWHHVTLLYDRRNASLLLDGVEVGAAKGTGAMVSGNESIVIGDGQQKFVGKIDEVQIAAVILGEAFYLPEGVSLQSGLPAIHFDAGGNLDPLFHVTPEDVTLLFEDEGKKETIHVGVYGTVR